MIKFKCFHLLSLLFYFLIFTSFSQKDTIDINGCWQSDSNSIIEMVSGTSDLLYVNNGKSEKWFLYIKTDHNSYQNEIGSTYHFTTDNSFVWSYGLNKKIKVYGHKNNIEDFLTFEDF